MNEFEGGVVIVSHDARLLMMTNREMWLIHNQAKEGEEKEEKKKKHRSKKEGKETEEKKHRHCHSHKKKKKKKKKPHSTKSE